MTTCNKKIREEGGNKICEENKAYYRESMSRRIPANRFEVLIIRNESEYFFWKYRKKKGDPSSKEKNDFIRFFYEWSEDSFVMNFFCKEWEH